MSVADRRGTDCFAVREAICRDFERSSRLEWLETNHTGAFAMGTVAGVNTRRYHALLIASLHPPSDRFAILSRVEEQASIAGQVFELATVQYPRVVHPAGYSLLDEFRVDPFPVWCYLLGGAHLEKTICLLNGEQTVLIRYEASASCRLSVRLLLGFREYHSLTCQNAALDGAFQESFGRLSFKPYKELPELVVWHSGESFQADGLWFRNHEYLRELERGLDFREDLYSPGSLVFNLGAGRAGWIIATLNADRFRAMPTDGELEAILREEAARRTFPASSEMEALLRRALDQFRIVRMDRQSSLIAGYPWFTDWSRDTLISLPALRRAGFPDCETKEILDLLVKQRRHGLVPNRFSDVHSTPEYNTADATLWLLVAAHDYIQATADFAFLRDVIYPAVQDSLAWHCRGTDFDIRVDPSDGLLRAGSENTQLTWMDARVNGRPVTPRNGKPVEINALWYNVLKIASRWAAQLGHQEEQCNYEMEAERVLRSFQEKFWNEELGCLYDVVTSSAPDARIRPNQLFALSLPFPLLDETKARRVLNTVQRLLLTPVGLRTLDPRDPEYCARFEGPMSERDRAYHQGTVWPWLIGPFVNAYLFAHGNSAEALLFCRNLLERMARELCTCCLGSFSEVYDAEPPHRPGGCPAQLWSVAQFYLAWQRVNLTARPHREERMVTENK